MLVFNGDKNLVTAVCVQMKAEIAPDGYVMTSCCAPPSYAQFRWIRVNAEFESGSQIRVGLTFLFIFKTHRYFNTFHLPKHVGENIKIKIHEWH